MERTLERNGIKRPGQPADGSILAFADDVLKNKLLAMNEVTPLDFDPTGDSIPEERVHWLTEILWQLISGAFDRQFNPAVLTYAEGQLLASVVGPSDFVDEEPRNY